MRINGFRNKNRYAILAICVPAILVVPAIVEHRFGLGSITYVLYLLFTAQSPCIHSPQLLLFFFFLSFLFKVLVLEDGAGVFQLCGVGDDMFGCSL